MFLVLLLSCLLCCCLLFVIFFFKQKTAYEMRISDWSSDVCSSDLLANSTPKADDRNRGRVEMDTFATLRASVDSRTARENRLLRETIRLLIEQCPLADWPDAVRDAVTGALADSGDDTTEDAKARRLQNHLFLDLPGVAADHDLRRTTAAERIRADLADLVPFGAGLYLVREDDLLKMARKP